MAKLRKVYCLYFLISFILLSSSRGLGYVSDSDIKVLIGEDYLSSTCRIIRNSQESIFLKMYLFTQDSFGKVLARELVEANKRGVEVEVILDKTGEDDRKNEKIYTCLKEAGIKVRYDFPGVLTHSKILIVDREIAVVGSQNWNKGSLSLNNEAGVLIRSKKISEGLLKGEVADDDNIITLTEDNYYTLLSKAFEEAKESIHILMYSLEKGTETRSLVKDLVEAKGRGVDIEIMLDQGFRDNLPEGKNITGINLLREHGLENRFDSVTRTTHAKLIVIDGEKTFLGSQNWLDMAEDQYDEDSLLIISEKVSEIFLQFISSITTSPSIFSEEEIGKGVKIPYSFLINETSPAPGVRLMDRGAGRAFKLYLLLLHAKSDEAGELNIYNRYEELAKPLGYDRSKIKRGKYYRNYYKQHISRFLRILEKLHLVKFDHRSGLATFLDPGGSGDAYAFPGGRYFVIPDNFWTYEWHRILSFKGIYLYLIGLLEKSLYPEEAWWSRSYKGMAELYEISPNTIWEALLELERYNLIEVYREAWEPDEDFADREKNKYHINRLYSMKDFESGWLDLKERYGEKLAQNARALAKELDEPYDLVVIESFIGLIRDFGLAKVKEANKKTASFRRSYGKRHFGYTKAILSGF